jgi:hypothetical protein
MSYDIYLFKPRDGESIEDAYERVIEGEDGGPTPDTEALKERLAGALIGYGTGLERFEFDYALIAESYEMTEEDAQTEFRHIELNSPEGGSGVQITIEDESATILIPYWHQADAARGVFDEVLQYLKVFERKPPTSPTTRSSKNRLTLPPTSPKQSPSIPASPRQYHSRPRKLTPKIASRGGSSGRPLRRPGRNASASERGDRALGLSKTRPTATLPNGRVSARYTV